MGAVTMPARTHGSLYGRRRLCSGMGAVHTDNPWLHLDITEPEVVLEEDARAVRAFNTTERSPEYRLDLSLIPEPWVGNTKPQLSSFTPILAPIPKTALRNRPRTYAQRSRPTSDKNRARGHCTI